LGVRLNVAEYGMPTGKSKKKWVFGAIILIPVCSVLFYNLINAVEISKTNKQVERIKELVTIGSPIETARTTLTNNGFNASEIDDVLQTGQALMMNVQLRPLNSCDKFRCATGIELRPRLTEPPHYVVFRANVDGIITKIEMK